MVNAINTAVANCANQQVNFLVLLTVTVWMNQSLPSVEYPNSILVSD